MIIVALLVLTVVISFATAEHARAQSRAPLSALEWEDPQLLGTVIFYGGAALCSIVVLATALIIHVRFSVIIAAIAALAGFLVHRKFAHQLMRYSLQYAAGACALFVIFSSLRR